MDVSFRFVHNRAKVRVVLSRHQVSNNDIRTVAQEVARTNMRALGFPNRPRQMLPTAGSDSSGNIVVEFTEGNVFVRESG